MSVVMGVFILISVVGVVLLVDVALRWRRRGNGIAEITDFRGLVPVPVVAILGAVTTLVCGWVGWGLLIVAGLATAEAMRITATSSGPWERAIVVRLFMLFQLATVGGVIRYALTFLMENFS